MPLGRDPSPDSATRQLAALGIGDCFSRANVIPAWRFTPEIVLETQKKLRSTVDTAIVRAREIHPRQTYRTYATHSLTPSLDVMITIAAIRET
jgi:hypothetical protein